METTDTLRATAATRTAACDLLGLAPNANGWYTAGAVEQIIDVLVTPRPANVNACAWHVTHVFHTDTDVECPCSDPACVQAAKDIELQVSSLGSHLRAALREQTGIEPIEAFGVSQAAMRQLKRALVRQQRRQHAADLGVEIPEDSGLVVLNEAAIQAQDRRRRVSCIDLPGDPGFRPHGRAL